MHLSLHCLGLLFAVSDRKISFPTNHLFYFLQLSLTVMVNNYNPWTSIIMAVCVCVCIACYIYMYSCKCVDLHIHTHMGEIMRKSSNLPKQNFFMHSNITIGKEQAKLNTLSHQHYSTLTILNREYSTFSFRNITTFIFRYIFTWSLNLY